MQVSPLRSAAAVFISDEEKKETVNDEQHSSCASPFFADGFVRDEFLAKLAHFHPLKFSEFSESPLGKYQLPPLNEREVIKILKELNRKITIKARDESFELKIRVYELLYNQRNLARKIPNGQFNKIELVGGIVFWLLKDYIVRIFEENQLGHLLTPEILEGWEIRPSDIDIRLDVSEVGFSSLGGLIECFNDALIFNSNASGNKIKLGQKEKKIFFTQNAFLKRYVPQEKDNVYYAIASLQSEKIAYDIMYVQEMQRRYLFLRDALNLDITPLWNELAKCIESGFSVKKLRRKILSGEKKISITPQSYSGHPLLSIIDRLSGMVRGIDVKSINETGFFSMISTYAKGGRSYSPLNLETTLAETFVNHKKKPEINYLKATLDNHHKRNPAAAFALTYYYHYLLQGFPHSSIWNEMESLIVSLDDPLIRSVTALMCHHTEKNPPPGINEISALFQAKAFLQLCTSATEEGFKPTLIMHFNKPAIRVNVHGAYLLLPFDPANAFRTLHASENEEFRELVQKVIFPESHYDFENSPICKNLKKLNFDWDDLGKIIDTLPSNQLRLELKVVYSSASKNTNCILSLIDEISENLSNHRLMQSLKQLPLPVGKLINVFIEKSNGSSDPMKDWILILARSEFALKAYDLAQKQTKDHQFSFDLVRALSFTRPDLATKELVSLKDQDRTNLAEAWRLICQGCQQTKCVDISFLFESFSFLFLDPKTEKNDQEKEKKKSINLFNLRKKVFEAFSENNPYFKSLIPSLIWLFQQIPDKEKQIDLSFLLIKPIVQGLLTDDLEKKERRSKQITQFIKVLVELNHLPYFALAQQILNQADRLKFYQHDRRSLDEAKKALLKKKQLLKEDAKFKQNCAFFSEDFRSFCFLLDLNESTSLSKFSLNRINVAFETFLENQEFISALKILNLFKYYSQNKNFKESWFIWLNKFAKIEYSFPIFEIIKLAKKNHFLHTPDDFARCNEIALKLINDQYSSTDNKKESLIQLVDEVLPANQKLGEDIKAVVNKYFSQLIIEKKYDRVLKELNEDEGSLLTNEEKLQKELIIISKKLDNGGTVDLIPILNRPYKELNGFLNLVMEKALNMLLTGELSEEDLFAKLKLIFGFFNSSYFRLIFSKKKSPLNLQFKRYFKKASQINNEEIAKESNLIKELSAGKVDFKLPDLQKTDEKFEHIKSLPKVRTQTVRKCFSKALALNDLNISKHVSEIIKNYLEGKQSWMGDSEKKTNPQVQIAYTLLLAMRVFARDMPEMGIYLSENLSAFFELFAGQNSPKLLAIESLFCLLNNLSEASPFEDLEMISKIRKEIVDPFLVSVTDSDEEVQRTKITTELISINIKYRSDGKFDFMSMIEFLKEIDYNPLTGLHIRLIYSIIDKILNQIILIEDKESALQSLSEILLNLNQHFVKEMPPFDVLPTIELLKNCGGPYAWKSILSVIKPGTRFYSYKKHPHFYIQANNLLNYCIENHFLECRENILECLVSLNATDWIDTEDSLKLWCHYLKKFDEVFPDSHGVELFEILLKSLNGLIGDDKTASIVIVKACDILIDFFDDDFKKFCAMYSALWNKIQQHLYLKCEGVKNFNKAFGFTYINHFNQIKSSENANHKICINKKLPKKVIFCTNAFFLDFFKNLLEDKLNKVKTERVFLLLEFLSTQFKIIIQSGYSDRFLFLKVLKNFLFFPLPDSMANKHLNYLMDVQDILNRWLGINNLKLIIEKENNENIPGQGTVKEHAEMFFRFEQIIPLLNTKPFFASLDKKDLLTPENEIEIFKDTFDLLIRSDSSSLLFRATNILTDESSFLKNKPSLFTESMSKLTAALKRAVLNKEYFGNFSNYLMILEYLIRFSLSRDEKQFFEVADCIFSLFTHECHLVPSEEKERQLKFINWLENLKKSKKSYIKNKAQNLNVRFLNLIKKS